MSEKVRPINFATVQWAMQEINEALLRGPDGLLIQAEVDDDNHIVNAKFVTLKDALNNGFEPARFAGKNGTQQPTP